MLRLASLPTLTAFGKGIQSIEFPVLEEMIICDCPKLLSFIGNNQIPADGHDEDTFHLFCSQKVFFPMLESLELNGLDKLEVIWNSPIPEGSHSFKNLSELELYNLPALIHLWKSPNLSVPMEFLSQLAKLDIRNCEMMEQVLFNEENENDGNQCHTIRFPKLMELRLKSLPTLAAFGKGIESIEFPVLEQMDIRDCPKLLSFIGNNQIQADSHDHGTFHLFCSQKVFFPSLKILELNGYDKLEVIWNSPIPEGSHSFKNLSQLKLFDLPALIHLWKSPNLSVSMEILSQLENLGIRNCELMEQVLFNEENENDGNQCQTIRFPKLMELRLESLPTLAAFGKGIESIEFPVLEEMIIRDCPKLLSFIGNNQIPADGHDEDTFHLFCDQKVFFPMLESLELNGLDKLEVIWSSPIPEGSHSFKNLRKLKLSNLPALNHLWKCPNLSVSMEFLPQLASLDIRNCKMMEQVFFSEENENDGNQCHTIRFPKLMELRLDSLPTLTAFGKGIESIEFPMLEEINIYDCPKLLSFIGNNQIPADGHDKDTFHLFCSQKVSFNSLKRVHIISLDKRNIGCHQISVGFFSQLEQLEILDCNSIGSLFSSSIAKNLVNLKKMMIIECNEMVKVIEDDEEMSLSEKPRSTLFPNLEELELCSLPKLAYFCNWRCDIHLPSLEQVAIEECPLLKFFTMKSVTTPKLEEITMDGAEKEVGDLNGAIQLHFEALQHQEDESTSTNASEVEERSQIEEEEIE